MEVHLLVRLIICFSLRAVSQPEMHACDYCSWIHRMLVCLWSDLIRPNSGIHQEFALFALIMVLQYEFRWCTFISRWGGFSHYQKLHWAAQRGTQRHLFTHPWAVCKKKEEPRLRLTRLWKILNDITWSRHIFPASTGGIKTKLQTKNNKLIDMRR